MTGGMGMGVRGTISINQYFVGENGSDIVKKLTATGTGYLFETDFKKAAVEYFKDCPALVSKIEEEVFDKNDIEKVVDFYNRECL